MPERKGASRQISIMAIVFQGKTQCRLCGRSLESKSEAMAFPAFVPKGHFFSSYSDSAYHRECLDKWEHRDAFLSLYAAYRAVWESRPVGLGYEEAALWFQERLEKVFASKSPDD